MSKENFEGESDVEEGDKSLEELEGDDSPEESPGDDMSEESEGDDSPEEENLELNLYGAFALGWQLQYLRQAGHNRYPVYSESNRHVINALSEVSGILDIMGTSPAIKSEVNSFEKELEREYVDDDGENNTEDGHGDDDSDNKDDDNEPPTLSIGYGNRLSNKVDTWRTVLKYELAEEDRFTIADAPVIDLENILQSPSSLFEDGVWNTLPEQTKQDLREGCMSLAAHCPTASVIMVLRSIEYILREWYKQELNEDEADDPWGTVLGQLQSKFNNEERDPDVLSNLDYLRRKRNEVNHPNRSPSLHEASVTILMASETITAMMEYIEIEDELKIENQV